MVAHLNIHTSYDLLHSSLRIKDVVNKAADEGYEALAITDTNVLYGYPQFYDACKEAGIKPIFGMTTHLTDNLDTAETVLLARDNQGLEDLYQLSSDMQLESKEEMPTDWLLDKYEHLIVIFKRYQATISH